MIQMNYWLGWETVDVAMQQQRMGCREQSELYEMQ